MSITNYFSFTQVEKRGVVVLLAIIFLLIITILFISSFDKKDPTPFSEFKEAISQFEKEQRILKSSFHPKEKKITLFKFNPNTISNEDWKKLGFEKWQINTINNYKAKGGYWKIKADVSKIYGLNNNHYEQLKPYILLPEKIKIHQKREKKKYANKTVIININSADTSNLKELRGIGPVLAKRIVKFRKALGGFIKIEQLQEIYGLKEETYLLIKPNIKLNNVNPKKININNSTSAALKAHPYINWTTANAIEKYRKANGSFKTIQDIKKIHLISNETYQKIEPYLTAK